MEFGNFANKFIQVLIDRVISRVKGLLLAAVCGIVYAVLYTNEASNRSVMIATIIMGILMGACTLLFLSYLQDVIMTISAALAFVCIGIHFLFIDLNLDTDTAFNVVFLPLGVMMIFSIWYTSKQKKQNELNNKQEQPINELPPKQ